MQQAVRVPDRTACMYLGEIIASGFTKQIFTSRTRGQREIYSNKFEECLSEDG
jgi:ABC-type phosphate transport system ATPase subunit